MLHYAWYYCKVIFDKLKLSLWLLILDIGYYNNEPVTKVMLKPITGRRHQIRVHCATFGHTIVGDFMYSNRKDVLPYRMFLHSHRMVLPTTLENLNVCSGDIFHPRDLKQWVPVQTLNTIGKSSYDKLDGDWWSDVIDLWIYEFILGWSTTHHSLIYSPLLSFRCKFRLWFKGRHVVEYKIFEESLGCSDMKLLWFTWRTYSSSSVF